MKFINLTFTLVLLYCCSSFTALAQYEHNEETHVVKYHNAVALFVGNTIIRPSGFNSPTIGLEYIREINDHLGIGIMSELEIGSHIIQIDEHNGTETEVERNSAALIIPSIFLRVYKGLIFTAGYGVELEKNENLALFKVSIEYKLYLQNDRFLVLPTISWDHTNKFDGIIYGVNFGYVF
jgi:hypothetical protein